MKAKPENKNSKQIKHCKFEQKKCGRAEIECTTRSAARIASGGSSTVHGVQCVR